MNFKKGNYVTMLTPYLADGSVDIDTVKKYVRFYHDHGVDGIFSLCQSSEILYLSLEEKVKIQQAVTETIDEIVKEGGRKLALVSSGHSHSDIAVAAEELNAVWKVGTEALILITNLPDPNMEGDDVWIENAEKLLAKLPVDAPLGLYECPKPYKRLVTPKILKWCLETGRFYYLKDTCCSPELLSERLDIIADTEFMLFNANAQTLLYSLEKGASGYCGVMSNIHPEFYTEICRIYKDEPEKAKIIEGIISTFAFIEGGVSYPLSAKYNMCLEGIPTNLITRNEGALPLDAYGKLCVENMKTAADKLKELVI